MNFTLAFRSTRCAIALLLVLWLGTACVPVSPQSIPTLYVIPTWPPTSLTTIAPLSDVPPAETTAIIEIAAIPASPTDVSLTPSPFPVTNCTSDALFIADVTIPNDTVLSTNQRFTKTWRLLNTGSCDWGAGYHLVFLEGDQMGGMDQIDLPAAAAGETIDLSLNLVAPAEPRAHLGWWQLVSPEGIVFGAALDVQVLVVPAQPTLIPTRGPTALPTPTREPQPSRMPTNTTAPAQGQPIASGYAAVSGISSRAREIYQAGKQRGNNSNVFIKVGDSMTDGLYFLTQIGYGQEVLGKYADLAPVINAFRIPLGDGSNPFSRDSKAATGGWNTVMMLDPGFADSDCGGANALECEISRLRPSIALVMLGTNDPPDHLSSGLYNQNMRRIVQTCVDNGIIPVLYTIPWTGMRDISRYNQVITNIARDYSIPLVDYYSLMEQLPAHGAGSDETHPSVPPDQNAANFSSNLGYGTTVRNLVTLQVLDALWRQVLYD